MISSAENILVSGLRISRRIMPKMPRDPSFRRGAARLTSTQSTKPGAQGVKNLRVTSPKFCSTMPESETFADYLTSPYPNLDLPDNVPLHEYMLNEFSKYGDHVALVNGITGKEITYAQLQTMIVKVASSLVAKGFGSGSVATIYSQNSPEYLIMYLAVGAAGGTVSTVNPAYTPEELRKAVNLTRSTVLIASAELVPNAADISTHCPTIKDLIVLGKADGWQPFSNLLEGDMSLFPTNMDINCKEHVYALPFSSGTTGLPKGVMLTHYNIVSNIIQSREPNILNVAMQDDCVISVLPYFHIYGQIVVSMVSLSSGVKVVSLPKFDPIQYLESIQKHRGTYIHVVTPLMLFLAKHPIVSKYDLSSISNMAMGAAPCGADLMQEVYDRFNKKSLIIQQGYGLTEASPLTHCNPLVGHKYHTCGPVISNTQFKIVDIETGKSLDKGEDGEVLVRGPQVMKGYFENETETAHTIRNGWLHTGDIGHYDEDGYVAIVDRIKELIKVKGFQVAPAELEALLVTHPSVTDAAVIGRRDDRIGEAPVAFVVLKQDSKPSDEMAKELQDFVSDRVAPYKRLVGGVQFRKEIPKAASGKILRRVLRDEL